MVLTKRSYNADGGAVVDHASSSGRGDNPEYVRTVIPVDAVDEGVTVWHVTHTGIKRKRPTSPDDQATVIGMGTHMLPINVDIASVGDPLSKLRLDPATWIKLMDFPSIYSYLTPKANEAPLNAVMDTAAIWHGTNVGTRTDGLHFGAAKKWLNIKHGLAVSPSSLSKIFMSIFPLKNVCCVVELLHHLYRSGANTLEFVLRGYTTMVETVAQLVAVAAVGGVSVSVFGGTLEELTVNCTLMNKKNRRDAFKNIVMDLVVEMCRGGTLAWTMLAATEFTWLVSNSKVTPEEAAMVDGLYEKKKTGKGKYSSKKLPVRQSSVAEMVTARTYQRRKGSIMFVDRNTATTVAVPAAAAAAAATAPPAAAAAATAAAATATASTTASARNFEPTSLVYMQLASKHGTEMANCAMYGSLAEFQGIIDCAGKPSGYEQYSSSSSSASSASSASSTWTSSSSASSLSSASSSSSSSSASASAPLELDKAATTAANLAAAAFREHNNLTQREADPDTINLTVDVSQKEAEMHAAALTKEDQSVVAAFELPKKLQTRIFGKNKAAVEPSAFQGGLAPLPTSRDLTKASSAKSTKITKSKDHPDLTGDWFGECKSKRRITVARANAAKAEVMVLREEPFMVPGTEIADPLSLNDDDMLVLADPPVIANWMGVGRFEVVVVFLFEGKEGKEQWQYRLTDVAELLQEATSTAKGNGKGKTSPSIGCLVEHEHGDDQVPGDDSNTDEFEEQNDEEADDYHMDI
jgi:hypothetical protein